MAHSVRRVRQVRRVVLEFLPPTWPFLTKMINSPAPEFQAYFQKGADLHTDQNGAKLGLPFSQKIMAASMPSGRVPAA